jgi:FxsC-like protein
VLYFFLSYARGDDDVYVERFYHDLCIEVRVHIGAARDEEVGFLDNHSIEPGQRWSQALVEALTECSSFLALYSPAYFLSKPCGKEWAMFAQRLRLHPADVDGKLAGLIPLIWLPPRVMPDFAQSLQYNQDTFGEPYNRGGLRQLLRLQRHRDTYLEFVSVVAERIIEAAASPPPRPPGHLDFDRIESAFHPQLDAPDISAVNLAPVLPGVHFIHFVVAAPSRSEATAVRANVSYYGERAQDWAPFRPALPDPLAEYAQKVAADQRFRSAVATVEQLHECIKLASQHNQIVVLLVDAWSAELQRHRRVLEEYDQRNEPTSAVLIVMSHDDEETQQHSAELVEHMRRALLNNSLRPDDLMIRRSVLSHHSFQADLQVVLEVARNRLFRRGRVFRLPAQDSSPPRPILEGP